AQSTHVAAVERYTFGVLGDTPYNSDEESQFIAVLAEMNHERLAFAVHVGDFKSATTPCSDEMYLQRRDWFELAHHPIVYVPGDNDWTDCWRPFGASADPLERMAKLRELFFSDDERMGQSRLRVMRQNIGGMPRHPYPEHLQWTHSRVVFVTLNAPGPDNNRTRMPNEAADRLLAARDWLHAAFAKARRENLPGVVVLMQANPWRRTGGPRAPFVELLNDLASEATRYSGTVLLVHGDTHRYRVDQPLVHPTTHTVVPNVTRVEVFGSPQVNWVRITATVERETANFRISPGSRYLGQSDEIFVTGNRPPVPVAAAPRTTRRPASN
ncbi:MAG TPA: hypothetical protein VLN59_09545, partial [Burkholderiales bacterium]|nr:hypothetical protein [Burkholderiales bacterium]